jgi:RNA polymerase sigma factor (sigma-70 family)
MSDRDTEVMLIERLREQDASVLDILMERYSPRIYRVAFGITRSHGDAEEVVQDVFLTLFRKIDSFEGRAALGTWLYRVAANAALIKRRGKRAEVEARVAELIAAMKSKGAWQMAPTLTREISTYIYAERPKFLDEQFFTRGTPASGIEQVTNPQFMNRMKNDPDFERNRGLLVMAKGNLRKLSDAGVRIGFGTDTGPTGRFQGYFEHMEMELMVEAGLTPMQVITAATKSGAEFLGARDRGTLEAGKWADLIVMTKNPLEDIRNTKSLEAVWIAGKLVK